MDFNDGRHGWQGDIDRGKNNKNLAIANRSRVSCARNTSRASIGLGQESLKVTGNGAIG